MESQTRSRLFGRAKSKAVAVVPSDSRAASATPPPLSPAKKKAVTKKTDKVVPKESKLISEEDMATSLNSAIAALPREHKVGETFDFDNANRIYQNFFTDCQDAFVFGAEA